MDSVIMTTPGNGPRLRSRLRSAANAICARTSKNHIHHTYPRISALSHQNFNSHGKHKGIPFVFANGGVTKVLQKSGSFSAGKKGNLSAAAIDVKSPAEDAETHSKDGVDGQQTAVEESAAAVETSPATYYTFGGKLSREAVEAWGARVGPRTRRAPADSLQLIFNDLNLYPSKTQVFEMLVVARQCARRPELSLSFGEFCTFAAQLRRYSVKRTISSKDDIPSLPQTDFNKTTNQIDTRCTPIVNLQTENGTVSDQQHPYEVFLGGSCNPTTWRWDVAIPTLDKMGITYYNPQVADWSQELIEIEHRAKQSARVLFFVLDADTRAAAAAVEAAHLAAAPRPLVLVLQPYRRGQRIGGEVVSDQEYLDLSRGQAILQEVAERRALPVFTELGAALRCTQRLLRGGGPLRSITSSPTIANHLLKVKKAFDTADETKSGILTSTQALSALKAFTNLDLQLAQVDSLLRLLGTHKTAADYGDRPFSNLTNGEKQTVQTDVDFELFCSLLAEIMEEADYVNDTIVISNTESPNLDDLEKQIRILLRWESKSLIDSLTYVSDSPTRSKLKETVALPTTGLATDPELSDSPTRWRSRLTKWRQFLQSVQAAVSNLVAKIEFNSTRSTEPVPNVVNGRQNLRSEKSNGSPTLSGSKTGTTYSRRREQDGGGGRLKHRNSNEGQSSDDSQSSRNGKPTRKLSVFIPQVMVGSDGDAALTPQSIRRFEGLADSVRDEPVVMRDVYLGGSCIVRSTWREDQVIPDLEKNNLTYYVPAMNDYSRMFSAPPYTPANGGRFTFDVSNKTATTNNGVRRQNSKTSSQRKHNEPTEEVSSRLEFDYEGRATQKHERSPTFDNNDDQPEKKPKYSEEKGNGDGDDEDQVEVREKSSRGPYPLHSGGDNRLSASDFYRIPENASPAPFRGMYDDRQIWGSRVLFFGVTSDTRCLAPMVLAAHCIGLRPKSVVLCVQLLDHPQGLSERAVKDYNRGRLYLIDLAKRENVPVFDNMEEATRCVIQKINNEDY